MRNAAAEYRRAFACLPETNLAAYSRGLNGDEAESEHLIERGREALEILHNAARYTNCDWRKHAQDSVNVDDFAGSRCLAMLAMFRAQSVFRRGDDQAGLDDLVAVMGLGPYIGQGKRVSGLAGFPLEDLAVKKAFDAAKSNPLLPAELQSFDRVRPIWDHFQKRLESLRTAADAG